MNLSKHSIIKAIRISWEDISAETDLKTFCLAVKYPSAAAPDEINGIETARTSFGGVCQVPLYLIISLGVDEKVYDNEYLPASMIVDYVRCYQYK